MNGDVLRVVRGPWSLPHYGVSARNDQAAIEVDLAGVASAVPLAYFSRGFPIEVVRQAAPWEAEQIVARAREKLGTPWNAITFNCETLVAYAVTGKEQSWTVENAAKVLLVCGIAALVSRKSA